MALIYRRLILSLLAGLMAASVQAVPKESKAIPKDSPRLSVHASSYTLADPRVALRKIHQVQDKKDKSQVMALIKAYRENNKRSDGYSLSIQISILQTLAALKSPAAVPFLLQEFRTNNDVHYKDEIVFALGEIGDPKAVPELRAYLQDLKSRRPQDPMIRYQWETYVQRVQEALQKLKALP